MNNYENVTVPANVKHRRKVPFEPRIIPPLSFSLAIGEIERLDSELNRFILKPADYIELSIDALASNIHFATSIEGNPLSNDEVKRLTRESMQKDVNEQLFEDPGKREILNHLLAWNSYDMFRLPWDNDIVRKLHSMLFTDSLVEGETGHFRKSAAVILENDTEVFEGAPPEHVEEEIASLLSWLNSYASGLKQVVAATVFFHEFESIHPFGDGNGRIGRTLFHQYLRQAGLNNAHLCLIESELLSNTRLYYTLLAWTDYCNSYTELLDYFTVCIRNAYSKAYDKFRSKNLLSGELDEIETRLLMKAKEHDLPFTISEAARWLQNRSEATVRMHLNKLVELEVLKSAGHTRSKRYFYSDPSELIATNISSYLRLKTEQQGHDTES